jgi:hypothetical protein
VSRDVSAQRFSEEGFAAGDGHRGAGGVARQRICEHHVIRSLPPRRSAPGILNELGPEADNAIALITEAAHPNQVKALVDAAAAQISPHETPPIPKTGSGIPDAFRLELSSQNRVGLTRTSPST